MAMSQSLGPSVVGIRDDLPFTKQRGLVVPEINLVAWAVCVFVVYGLACPPHSIFCIFASISCIIAQPLRAYNAPMPRSLVWVKDRAFEGFGCSECRWVFRPSGALVPEPLERMKRRFEAERDKEFAAHACAQHPKFPEQKGE
jgi:hypothetical protein